MSEYNQYITAVNKIFDYLAKMRVGWSAQDNLNYIGSIEEYKQTVIKSLSLFKQTEQAPTSQPANTQSETKEADQE